MKIFSISIVFIAYFIMQISICGAQENNQQSFTLKEAQEYAVINSYKTQSSDQDVKIAGKQVRQYTAIGMPQVYSKGNFSYYINLPTSLLPNFFTPAIEGVLLQHGLITPMDMTPTGDDKFEVQFGSKYNLSGDISASQMIFDGTFLIGLKTAKVYVELTQTNYIKSQQEVKENVAKAYYLVLVAKENKKILDSTIYNMQKTNKEINELYKNGFIEVNDVDQITLLLSNLDNKRSMVERQIEVAKGLLKFQMGIPQDSGIILADSIEYLVNQAVAANLLDQEFVPENHIDYKIFNTSDNIQRLQYKMDKFKYLPTINGFGSLSYSAQRGEMNFFKSGEDYPWYKTTLVGLSVSIPLWNSGIRHYQLQMDKLKLRKNEIIKQQLSEALTLDVLNSKSALKTYTDQYITEIKNLELARNIYDKTFIKYREGVGTSMELTQAHNQYLTTQGNYFNTLLELLNSYSNLNKALNNY